jgi:hypothetical protein
LKTATTGIKDRLSEALDEAVRERARVIFTDEEGKAVGAVIGPDDLALLELVDDLADARLANEALAEAEGSGGFVSSFEAKRQLGLE